MPRSPSTPRGGPNGTLDIRASMAKAAAAAKDREEETVAAAGGSEADAAKPVDVEREARNGTLDVRASMAKPLPLPRIVRRRLW